MLLQPRDQVLQRRAVLLDHEDRRFPQVVERNADAGCQRLAEIHDRVGESYRPARFVEPAHPDETLGRIVPVGEQPRAVPADKAFVDPHLRLVAQIVVNARNDDDQTVAGIGRLADQPGVVGRLA